MLPRLLPLLAGLMPFTAMCGAFLIGRAFDVLPPCNPVLDGCLSISATGRREPGSFLFKALMLPYSLVLAFLWYYAVQWLRALDSMLRRSDTIAILVSGMVGALALILYVTFLGTKEPFYEFMRRTGIYFAFFGTGLAQLFVSTALLRAARRSRSSGRRGRYLACRWAYSVLACSIWSCGRCWRTPTRRRTESSGSPRWVCSCTSLFFTPCGALRGFGRR